MIKLAVMLVLYSARHILYSFVSVNTHQEHSVRPVLDTATLHWERVFKTCCVLLNIVSNTEFPRQILHGLSAVIIIIIIIMSLVTGLFFLVILLNQQ